MSPSSAELLLQEQLEAAEKINKVSILNCLEPSALAKLARYTEALERWSPKIDLVSPAPLAQLVSKHIVDSVLGIRLLLSTVELSNAARVVDLGSGAGLPGLVAALIEPERFFLLVEPREKRSYFLRDMLRELEIHNSKVLRKRGEDLNAEEKENVELIVTRAVNRKVNLAAIAENCVRNTGRLAVFSAETSLERAKQGILAPRKLDAFLSYTLPLDGAQRSIVISCSAA